MNWWMIGGGSVMLWMVVALFFALVADVGGPPRSDRERVIFGAMMATITLVGGTAFVGGIVMIVKGAGG